MKLLQCSWTTNCVTTANSRHCWLTPLWMLSSRVADPLPMSAPRGIVEVNDESQRRWRHTHTLSHQSKTNLPSDPGTHDHAEPHPLTCPPTHWPWFPVSGWCNGEGSCCDQCWTWCQPSCSNWTAWSLKNGEHKRWAGLYLLLPGPTYFAIAQTNHWLVFFHITYHSNCHQGCARGRVTLVHYLWFYHKSNMATLKLSTVYKLGRDCVSCTH